MVESRVRSILFAVALFASLPISAQPAPRGSWVAAPVDVGALLAQDELDQTRPGLPLRIGLRMEVDLGPKNSGEWEELRGGGQVWRLKVESREALWLVLGFDRFRLPAGAVMTVSDPNRRTVLGPYTTLDVREHGELWLPPVAGDALVVELTWPESLRELDPALHLGTVSHGYKNFGTIGAAITGPGSTGGAETLGSGGCNVDVNCPLGANWQNQKRGAVILLSGGSGFCSGSLINTTANDCRPYVLTAAHCGAGVSTTFGFNYERPGCASGSAPPPTTQVVSGAAVRANYSSSDFTLLEMSSAPPANFGVYYSGWSRSPTAPTESWCIHHPSADVKKITFNDDALVNGSNWGANHWRVTEWEIGTTEGGSSGSPLFDQNQRIVGQLHGGSASCSSLTYDEFGKLDASWTGGGTATTRLSNWLDPTGTGAVAMDGVAETTCSVQLAGTVVLTESLYACSDAVAIQLRDDHLQGQSTVTVAVRSSTETPPENVVLTAIQPGSGSFAGNFQTTGGPVVPGNGVLSVVNADTLTVRYIDADNGAGGSSIVVEDTATVDCAPPIITNVEVTNVTGSSALVTWTTNEPADSAVTWGLTPPGSSTTTQGTLATSHSITLQTLQECRNYVFSVASVDAAGNSATANNGGAMFPFTTGANVSPEYPATGAPVPIPDNNPTGATSTITVADNKTVLDVNVVVNITHPYTGDLVISLITPTNQTITLANRRGGGGDNFVSTLFDDEAATAIASGTPPFTGSFRPDQPLAATDGINAAGAWRLRVVDQAGADVGTINSWTLHLTYPAEACGPNAAYAAHLLDADTCSAGGVGSTDSIWDPGEEIRFKITLANDGSTTLTGVSATLSSSTPGVLIVDGQASFPSIAAGSTATSHAPHVTVQLPEDLACGSALQFALAIASDQGVWNPSFTQTIGLAVTGGSLALSEDFSSGIPASWNVVDGGGAGETWYADDATDPGGCANTDPAAPIAGRWAAVDSDCAGSGVAFDEQLVTPAIDLTAAATATVEFDHWFRQFQTEIADLDLRSSATGGAWVNLRRWTGASTANPQHETVDLTALAAGATNVQVRWRYYAADFEWFWYVDNVSISYTAPSECTVHACTTDPEAPPPVSPDMRASRLVDDGSMIEVLWNAACPAVSTKLIYGPLDQVATLGLAGSVCGVTSPLTWTAAPSGSLWFVMVNDTGNGVEGSWGAATDGERNGAAASAFCGSLVKDSSRTCP